MINPVALQLGPIAIHWYSISYLIALTIGFLIMVKLNKTGKVFKSNDQIFDLAFWIFILGAIIGGRLGYVLFYNFSYYLSSPLDALKVWEGGMSMHGGVIVSILVIYFFCRKNKIKFFKAGDLVVIPTALALMFTRIANFINHELIGRPILNSNWNWLGIDFGDGILRYPSQFFQSASALILFLILLILFYKKPKTGVISFSYLILYGLFRFITEFWRAPDIQIGFIFKYFTLGQFFSLGMLIAGIMGLIYIHKKMK